MAWRGFLGAIGTEARLFHTDIRFEFYKRMSKLEIENLLIGIITGVKIMLLRAVMSRALAALPGIVCRTKKTGSMVLALLL